MTKKAIVLFLTELQIGVRGKLNHLEKKLEELEEELDGKPVAQVNTHHLK